MLPTSNLYTEDAAIAAYKVTHSIEPSYTKLYWPVANAVGIEESLIIQIIEQWCRSNERAGKQRYFQSGEWWTALTYDDWRESYPALGTKKSIQKRILQMEKDEYIFSCQPNKTREKYYRINSVKVGLLLLESLSVVTKSDDVNDTVAPIVTKSDHTSSLKVTMNVTKSDHIPPAKPYTASDSATLIDKEKNKGKKINQSRGEIEGKPSSEDEEVTQNPVAVQNSKELVQNDKTLHEGKLTPARENDSQKIEFNAAPTNEPEFLAYYKSYRKTQGTDIKNPAKYVASCLNKEDEGAIEIENIFREWKGHCSVLERKISDYAENPEEIKRTKERYDFENWDYSQHESHLNMLQSRGLKKFCEDELFARWYQWASAKHPNKFTNIPA